MCCLGPRASICSWAGTVVDVVLAVPAPRPPGAGRVAGGAPASGAAQARAA